MTETSDVYSAVDIIVANADTELPTARKMNPRESQMSFLAVVTVAATVFQMCAFSSFFYPQSTYQNLKSESHIPTKYNFSQEQESKAV